MTGRVGTSLRTFTLIELLVVLAIIATLASLIMGGLIKAKERAQIADATADISKIKMAIAMYNADTRRHPEPPGTLDTPAKAMRDASPFLFAGLMAKPTLGGGPNAPYFKASWTQKRIGILEDRAKLEADTMGKDGISGARLLTSREMELLPTGAFQQLHGPTAAQPLVLLDPWGNPYHYRVWEGVDSRLKERWIRSPIRRTNFTHHPNSPGGPPLVDEANDLPHAVVAYDIWSNGPNGINEYGAGDDIVSWSR